MRIQLVTIIGAVVLLLAVLELVRQRRLIERYALLWLLLTLVLLALALWGGALEWISRALGIVYPPNTLFFVAIGCIVLLLLHFSSAVSRLGERSDKLAQRQALLEERLRCQETFSGLQNGSRPAPSHAGEHAPASGDARGRPASP